MEHLQECKPYNYEQRPQEDEYRCFGLGGNGFVKGGGGVAVHIGVLLGIGLAPEEIGILVKVFTPLVGREGGAHQAQDASRNGDHKHLRYGHHISVGI